MSDSVDRVFVHALNTVKKIPRLGTARPPPQDRLRLYGLYKQSMEGDVDGVMDRPTGDMDEIRSDQEKWDAWNAQKGISRTEAKRQYISTLIDTMHRYASNTPDARELVSELEFVWDQIKSNPPSSSSSNSYPLNRSHDSATSPHSTNDNVIYPVMSERGARNPGHRRNPSRTYSGGMRVLSPVSQSQVGGDDIPETDDDGDEQDEQGQGPGLEDREEFVDAQDSQAADGDEMLDSPGTESSGISEQQRPPSRSRDKGGGVMAPIARYIQNVRRPAAVPKEESGERWHRRVEAALIKMNTEMAALREQLEMLQDTTANSSSILHPFGGGGGGGPRRRKTGWLTWAFEMVMGAAAAVTQHILINAVLLVAVSLYMRWKGIPLERLEQLAGSWVRRVQRLAFVRRLGKMARQEGTLVGGTARTLGLGSKGKTSSSAG